MASKCAEYTGLSIFEMLKNRDELCLNLSNFILLLLRENTERLYAFLYRVDLNEQKVREVFRNDVHDTAIAKTLAEMVLERIEAKFFSRLKYSSGF